MQGVLADLAALEKAAAAADVAPPATSWADWEESLRVLAEGQSGQKAAAVGLRRALQARLQVRQCGSNSLAAVPVQDDGYFMCTSLSTGD